MHFCTPAVCDAARLWCFVFLVAIFSSWLGADIIHLSFIYIRWIKQGLITAWFQFYFTVLFNHFAKKAAFLAGVTSGAVALRDDRKPDWRPDHNQFGFLAP